jgi:hypothetical protein
MAKRRLKLWGEGLRFVKVEVDATKGGTIGEDIYNEDGTTSWQPQGSDFIDNEDGSTTLKPQGSDFTK